MNAYEKMCAIQQLSGLGSEFQELQAGIINLIRTVVGPEPAPPQATIREVVASAEPNLSELLTARNGGKIDAIKAHRNRTGLGLRESKEAIEKAGRNLGFYNAEGTLIVLIPTEKAT
ncbi:hypothetical protein [Singulisphaera sp. GP187]|uniref:hypothetical protein n=1 Tax=Singulisphaera sp. GP187 TaxID=1882752 RepID=UPI00135656F1|nr:hypothetical protein [Singulisphaera sp. GP187]